MTRDGREKIVHQIYLVVVFVVDCVILLKFLGFAPTRARPISHFNVVNQTGYVE